MSLILVPAFDDAIQGQSRVQWIKAFSRDPTELKWMMRMFVGDNSFPCVEVKYLKCFTWAGIRVQCRVACGGDRITAV